MMQWCPKCGGEYRDGFSICAACRVALSGHPPDKTSSPASGETAFPPPEPERPAYLVTLADFPLVELAKNILRENGIAVLTREACSSGALMRLYNGNSMYGQELYVDRDRLEEARGLLKAYLFSPDGAQSTL